MEKKSEVLWPFHMYKITMPKEKDIDAYEWLYISMVIITNRKLNLEECSYTAVARDTVTAMFMDRFSQILDRQTFDRVRKNAEKDFVHSDVIDSKMLNIFEIQEMAFYDEQQVKYIFQDAVTGRLLPHFYDRLEFISTGIKDQSGQYAKYKASVNKSIKTPSDRSIKNAYRSYSRLVHELEARGLGNLLGQGFESEFEDEEELDDFVSEGEDRVFLEDDDFSDEHEDSVPAEEETILDDNELNKIRIHVLEGTRTRYDLKVKVKSSEGVFQVISPFDCTGTDEWMKKSFTYGINQDSGLKKAYDELKTGDSIKEKYLDLVETKRTPVSSMKHCQSIYQMVDKLGKEDLRLMVFRMDYYYSRKDPAFFSELSILMEALVRNVDYIETSPESRVMLSGNEGYRYYTRRLDNLLSNKDLNYKPLKSKGIFNNWVGGENGTNMSKNNLKPKLVDIILNTDLSESELMTGSAIIDIFNLYDLRNKKSHYDSRDDISDYEQTRKLLRKEMTADMLKKAERSILILTSINGGE